MKRADGTWEPFDEYVLDFAIERLRSGDRVALVTLVHIEGSSPRPLGAQMAVSETGAWTGYLSGGCIERAVVAEALAAIQRGRSRRVRYGRGSKYLDIQLPCGSAIELVFDVTAGQTELEAIDLRLQSRLPATMHVPSLDRENPETFVRVYVPRTRLVVAGAGPSAVQLCRLGLLGGFDTALVTPDRATREEILRMAGVAVIPIATPQSPPTILADRHTAVVMMFHDHDWETKLLPSVLETNAFYIGALGSRKTHARRLEMLARAGIAADQAERIRGPAGLFESGKSASAIAISILAEIMQLRNAAVHDTAFRPDVYLLPAAQLSGLSLPFDRAAVHP